MFSCMSMHDIMKCIKLICIFNPLVDYHFLMYVLQSQTQGHMINFIKQRSVFSMVNFQQFPMKPTAIFDRTNVTVLVLGYCSSQGLQCLSFLLGYYIIWTHCCMLNPNCSEFRTITSKIHVSNIFIRLSTTTLKI